MIPKLINFFYLLILNKKILNKLILNKRQKSFINLSFKSNRGFLFGVSSLFDINLFNIFNSDFLNLVELFLIRLIIIYIISYK